MRLSYHVYAELEPPQANVAPNTSEEEQHTRLQEKHYCEVGGYKL